MSGPPKGRLVVVGGHSRRVGKTSIVKAILRATPDVAWQTVKISNHPHRAQNASTPTLAPDLLCLRDAEFGAGVAGIASLLADGCNLLVESNRIVSHLRADVVIFVVDPRNPDWKASSSACLERADALVFSQDGPSPAPLVALQKILPTFRLTNWNQPPLGFLEWMRERLAAVEVTSHETELGYPTHRAHARSADRPCPEADQMGQCAGARLDPFPVRSLGLV